MNRPFAIAILGPTASGKSAVAEQIANQLGTKILSADAFQVYKGLDIGTNKPVNKTLYRGLDLVEPGSGFSVGAFLDFAIPLCEREVEGCKHLVVCGGTGLYVRALFEGYEQIIPAHPDREQIAVWVKTENPKELLKRLGLDDKPPSDEVVQNPRHFGRWIERNLLGAAPTANPNWTARKLKFGLLLERAVLMSRIEIRLAQMFKSGWIDEVRDLLTGGVSVDSPGFKAIGYRQIAQYLTGNVTLDESQEAILVQTRQYAKRQMTWLRKEPNLIWLDANRPAKDIADEALSYLKVEESKEDGKVN